MSRTLIRLTPLGDGPNDRWVGPLLVNKGTPEFSDAPPGWKPGDPPYWPETPKPDIPPTSERARAGSVELTAGPRHYEISYDARGLGHEFVAMPALDTSHPKALRPRCAGQAPLVEDPAASTSEIGAGDDQRGGSDVRSGRSYGSPR